MMRLRRDSEGFAIATEVGGKTAVAGWESTVKAGMIGIGYVPDRLGDAVRAAGASECVRNVDTVSRAVPEDPHGAWRPGLNLTTNAAELKSEQVYEEGSRNTCLLNSFPHSAPRKYDRPSSGLLTSSN